MPSRLKRCGFMNGRILFNRPFRWHPRSNSKTISSNLSPQSTYLSVSSEKGCWAAIRTLFVDKLTSGFISWSSATKGYREVPEGMTPIIWEPECQSALQTILDIAVKEDYLDKLMNLWGQESTKGTSKPEVRSDHVSFIKSLGTWNMVFILLY